MPGPSEEAAPRSAPWVGRHSTNVEHSLNGHGAFTERSWTLNDHGAFTERSWSIRRTIGRGGAFDELFNQLKPLEKGRLANGMGLAVQSEAIRHAGGTGNRRSARATGGADLGRRQDEVVGRDDHDRAVFARPVVGVRELQSSRRTRDPAPDRWPIQSKQNFSVQKKAQLRSC
jgi:hypothetical protein